MRQVEALFKAPGARFTDDQLLAMANAAALVARHVRKPERLARTSSNASVNRWKSPVSEQSFCAQKALAC